MLVQHGDRSSISKRRQISVFNIITPRLLPPQVQLLSATLVCLCLQPRLTTSWKYCLSKMVLSLSSCTQVPACPLKLASPLPNVWAPSKATASVHVKPILEIKTASLSSHPVGSGIRFEELGQLSVSVLPHRNGRSSCRFGDAFLITALAAATQKSAREIDEYLSSYNALNGHAIGSSHQRSLKPAFTEWEKSRHPSEPSWSTALRSKSMKSWAASLTIPPIKWPLSPLLDILLDISSKSTRISSYISFEKHCILGADDGSSVEICVGL